MPEVSVSTDALTKVKVALNNYNSDISGFNLKIEQHLSDISKQTEFEMHKIANQVEETVTEIFRLKREINESESENERFRKEIELQTAEKRLDRLQDKQERMETALSKLKSSMDELLSVSKTFKTRAISKTEQSVGNIEKCISTIDSYLTQSV